MDIYRHKAMSVFVRAYLRVRFGRVESVCQHWRLTNGFSKKIENLEHAVALHFMHYNFCRIHKTLKTTPALEAGVADKLWSIEDIAKLLD